MTDEPRLPPTTLSQRIDAPSERVFAVLADAWLLPVWVVGATHIREVDDSWPNVGAKAHHQVGAWPFMLSDNTEVTACEPPHRLTLRGRAWPFGEATIDITIVDEDGSSTVTMAEAPVRGPARLLDNRPQRALLAARNRESLSRLASIVEHRRQA